jgi:hypothetical protein
VRQQRRVDHAVSQQLKRSRRVAAQAVDGVAHLLARAVCCDVGAHLLHLQAEINDSSAAMRSRDSINV